MAVVLLHKNSYLKNFLKFVFNFLQRCTTISEDIRLTYGEDMSYSSLTIEEYLQHSMQNNINTSRIYVRNIK